ncbi:putative tRNA wybutosine-synthesizing protein 3 [Naviculisporaceae sp. PSN 640]
MASSIFAQKKAKILSQLAVPETEYSDLSPKGSVDAGIRDLIDEINALEGVVTTSSCAGRVSVYLEGHKALGKGVKNEDGNRIQKEDEVVEERNPVSSSSAGGKGGGEWLFVSHDPLPESPSLVTLGCDNIETKSWSTVFGLDKASSSEQESTAQVNEDGSQPRLIHFKFEPMILHVLTASHELAQLVVQAGMEAGFRETGAVSLLPKHQSRDKEDPSSTASPIVAVRSMGLSFESLIGMETPDGKRSSLVSSEYLQLLVKISHERFAENQKRIARFREALKAASSGYSPSSGDNAGNKKKNMPEGWEDSEARKERKRLEGLRRKEELARQREREQEEKLRAADQGGALDLDLVLEAPDVL